MRSLCARLFFLPLVLTLSLLSGCASRSVWLFHPQGAVADAELHYTIIDFATMSGIVGPILIMFGVFLFRYRKSRKAAYDPSFTRSPIIEVLIWGVPLATVGFLTYFSYRAVMLANPYDPTAITASLNKGAGMGPAAGPASHFRPYTRAGRPSDYKNVLQVDVITTDWQWVFIYPKQRIATIDRLIVPVNTPVHFQLTSATVVNDFFIPELVGEIDIMPGMRTKQAMIASRRGRYHGYSADFSGGGFSWMGFETDVVSRRHFMGRIHRIQRAPHHLTYTAFNAIAQPTINLAERTQYFSQVQNGLFDHVIHRILMGQVYTTPLRMTESMTRPMAIQIIQ